MAASSASVCPVSAMKGSEAGVLPWDHSWSPQMYMLSLGDILLTLPTLSLPRA
jgi:hypothetical protein